MGYLRADLAQNNVLVEILKLSWFGWSYILHSDIYQKYLTAKMVVSCSIPASLCVTTSRLIFDLELCTWRQRDFKCILIRSFPLLGQYLLYLNSVSVRLPDFVVICFWQLSLCEKIRQTESTEHEDINKYLILGKLSDKMVHCWAMK